MCIPSALTVVQSIKHHLCCNGTCCEQARARESGPQSQCSWQEATQKFQSLQQIYGILSDEDKYACPGRSCTVLTAFTLSACQHEPTLCRRKRYDQTGSLEEADELNSQSFDDLYSFYRDLYKKVSTEDIDSFSAQYRGSEEETADLIKHFQRFKGNMSQVHSSMPNAEYCCPAQGRTACCTHSTATSPAEAWRCADILSCLAGVPVADVL